MVCIYCSNETGVINSRHKRATNQVWRRRQCEVCQAVFTTNEIADIAAAVRIEDSQGLLKPLSRDKLFLSVYSSVGHRKTALKDATALTDTILAKAMQFQSKPGVVTKNQLTTAVLRTLKAFDEVAATHYAAYHPLN